MNASRKQRVACTPPPSACSHRYSTNAHLEYELARTRTSNTAAGPHCVFLSPPPAAGRPTSQSN